MKKKPGINREIVLMLMVVIISVSFIFLVFSYYGKIMENADAASEELNRVYQYQYEMIVDSRNLTFWKDVYDNAREEALKHGAVLEIKGLENGEDYDKADYMDMSIAAQVDGIILEYNGEDGIQEKINEAVEKGIPVVTIVNDAPRSLRQSFVGINDYQMGTVYGAQVADLLDDETKRVEVLLNWETDLGQNQLYAQINSAVEKKSSGKRKIKIHSRNMMSHSQFDTEEEIRSIFQPEEDPPDILVCLDEVTTECAYQAMIDYNMVGEIKIIGYYTSKTIMDAVKNYIYILNVRFAGDIHYSTDVDESVLECKVPSMILQPIVENAVNHGIRNIDWEETIFHRMHMYSYWQPVCCYVF